MSNTFDSKHLSAAQLDAIGAKLAALKVQAMNSSEENRRELAELNAAPQIESGDTAFVEEGRNRLIKQLERDNLMLNKVAVSLGRLRAGCISQCSCCTDPIPYERLVARPVTDSCMDCKVRNEKVETNFAF